MKGKTRFITALGIIAVLFSVFAFVVPFVRNVGFWVAYAAEMIAIVLQYPIFHSAFGEDSARSRFYGLPIARLGYIYIGVQTALSLAIFALGFVPDFSSWLSALVCLAVLAWALLGIIKADAARDQIQQLDTKKQASTDMITALRDQAAALPTLASDSDFKQQLTSLAEDLRFSDPISSPQTDAIELEISDMLFALKVHLADGKADAHEISLVKAKLSQRNAICRRAK
ncbi:MAG: hypothetical protein NC093_10270 [Alistipes sp.]|nr:hypothetical protein [Alistipes sp.]